MTTTSQKQRFLLKKSLIFLSIFCLCFLFACFIISPTFAKKGEVIQTTFFGPIIDDGEGCAVFMVLNLIVEIMTYGVGVAAVIGIVITGITYLTARGDEARTTKAKRRILEIVIGLIVYVVLWSLLNFLLPGGKFTEKKECKKASVTSSTIVSSTQNNTKTS